MRTNWRATVRLLASSLDLDMRAFFISLIVSGILCFTLWHHLRDSAGERGASVPPPVRRVGPKPLGSALGERDPLQAAKGAWKEFASREARDLKISADNWALLDALSVEEIAEWGRKLKPDFHDRRWEAVMMRWASLDGRAAMDHAKTYGESYDSIRNQMLACWIRNDPAGAAEEISAMKVWNEPAFATLMQVDLGMALDLVGRTLKSIQTENADLGIHNQPGFQLAAQMSDPAREAQFRSWLAKQSDIDIAARVFSMVYSQMALGGDWLRPERLPDYMPGKDQIPQTLEDPDSVWAMGAIAAGQNPIVSIEQKENAPYPRRTDAPPKYSLATRFRDWAGKDPESAGRWLVAQEAWPERDAAIQGYIAILKREDPAAASKWATQLSDDAARVNLASYPYEKWYQLDPVAAEAWLDTSDFSDLHRNYLKGGAILGR